jgi:hypothetical protein
MHGGTAYVSSVCSCDAARVGDVASSLPAAYGSCKPRASMLDAFANKGFFARGTARQIAF